MAVERTHRCSKVIPELRRLHSPDIFDLESETPEDVEDFSILVQAMIGPKDQEGEESFDILVCTPKWLAKNIPDCGYLFTRHYLFLSRYSYETLLDAINTLCGQFSGDTWDEVAQLIARFGKWEFEDYQE